MNDANPSRLLKKGFSQPADLSVISPKGESYRKAAIFSQGVENQLGGHLPQPSLSQHSARRR
jgi:hypothetical protein